ncbi:MAG: hypothetical protein H0W06_04345 [Chloroflexia bacterium]|nr:hypothetical protein [Chloroflexia bacterium]MBA3639877.1 hypothetical protein [Acidobacteriota bacterium]
MPRSVSQKMGIKEGTRTLYVHAPESALKSMMLPSLEVRATLDGDFGYIHLFAVTQAEMNDMFPKLSVHLGATGMLWVSWPKGRKLGTDLTLPHVIRIGYSHGLVESTTLSVDGTWSAIKFTHPKRGKVYKNSYGQLPSE